MRLVIDTNVLISALLTSASPPAHLIEMWREGYFDLLTSAEQLDELMRVTRYPKLRARIPPALAGRLINELRAIAVNVTNLPQISASPDPNDDYLLAMAAVGRADFLVTGDKRHLLDIKVYAGTKIVSVHEFMVLQRR